MFGVCDPAFLFEKLQGKPSGNQWLEKLQYQFCLQQSYMVLSD